MSRLRVKGELIAVPTGVKDDPVSKTSAAAIESELALKTQGQRAINLIWETTQMRIALSVIWASLLVSASLAILGKYLGTPDVQLAAVVFLFGVANLVTGFYFGRTNHARSGGAGGDKVLDSR